MQWRTTTPPTVRRIAGSVAPTPERKPDRVCVAASEAATPNTRPVSASPQTLAEHHSEQVPPRRAEGGPHAELGHPLRRGVKNHPVGADRRQQERRPGESSRKATSGSATVRPRRRRAPAVSASSLTGTFGFTLATSSRISPAIRARFGRRPGARRFMARGQLPVEADRLRVGHIEGPAHLGGARVGQVVLGARHRARRPPFATAGPRPAAGCLPSWILTGPVSPGRGGTHQHDSRRRFSVAFGEESPPDQRDAHQAEILGRNGPRPQNIGARFSVGVTGWSSNSTGRAAYLAAQWERVYRRRARHPINATRPPP